VRLSLQGLASVPAVKTVHTDHGKVWIVHSQAETSNLCKETYSTIRHEYRKCHKGCMDELVDMEETARNGKNIAEQFFCENSRFYLLLEIEISLF
jgi:hypothetical protein